MPRQKRRPTKRNYTMGIALEVATLLAILLLARPDWIARGFQIIEKHQSWQQAAPQEAGETGYQQQKTGAIISDNSDFAQQTEGIFPPALPVNPPELPSNNYNSPAVVVPAREWLPGYFDVVQYHDQMPYGQQPYRLSTPMDPWSRKHEQHF